MINQYLMQLSSEAADSLYSSLAILQYPSYVAMLSLASAKYRIPVKQKVLLWVSFLIAMLWGTNIPPILSKLTSGVIPGINLGVGFAFVVLILAAVAYFLNIPVLLSLDAAIPAFILGRGLAITGCIFTGCCHGFPVSWGIYSNVAEAFTFPTVPLDIVASCCIALYLILLANKHKWSGNGVVAANGMILFGILRILIDIFRDNQKLLLMLTAEGLFGIAYVAAGFLLLRYINHSRYKNVIQEKTIHTIADIDPVHGVGDFCANTGIGGNND